MLVSIFTGCCFILQFHLILIHLIQLIHHFWGDRRWLEVVVRETSNGIATRPLLSGYYRLLKACLLQLPAPDSVPAADALPDLDPETLKVDHRKFVCWEYDWIGRGSLSCVVHLMAFLQQPKWSSVLLGNNVKELLERQ